MRARPTIRCRKRCIELLLVGSAALDADGLHRPGPLDDWSRRPSAVRRCLGPAGSLRLAGCGVSRNLKSTPYRIIAESTPVRKSVTITMTAVKTIRRDVEPVVGQDLLDLGRLDHVEGDAHQDAADAGHRHQLQVAGQEQGQEQLEEALEDAGQRRDRADLDVGRRAGQAPVCGKPLSSGTTICTSPCPQNSLLGLNGVPRLSASRSAIREQSRLSTPETNTMATTR